MNTCSSVHNKKHIISSWYKEFMKKKQLIIRLNKDGGLIKWKEDIP